VPVSTLHTENIPWEKASRTRQPWTSYGHLRQDVGAVQRSMAGHMGIDVPPLSAEISIRSLYPLPTYPLDWALRTTALLTRACGGGDEVFFFFF
jgi:hypothetical protein